MSTYEWITAVGAAATAMATGALAAFAHRAFRASVAQLRLLQADSARQVRPYVNIDLAPGLHGIGFWDVTIENVGRSNARDVHVDAGSLEARDKEDHISERLETFLSRPMTLPPGARRRVMWRMEASENHAVAGAPDDVDVRVTYKDDVGATYADTFNVATAVYAAISPGPATGSTVSGGGRSKAEESLANIERALKALNTHVGMMRS